MSNILKVFLSLLYVIFRETKECLALNRGLHHNLPLKIHVFMQKMDQVI